MCSCENTRVCRYALLCVHMCKGQMGTLAVFLQGCPPCSIEAWLEFTGRLGCLSSKSQGSTCSCLPSSEITKQAPPTPVLMWVLRSKLMQQAFTNFYQLTVSAALYVSFLWEKHWHKSGVMVQAYNLSTWVIGTGSWVPAHPWLQWSLRLTWAIWDTVSKWANKQTNKKNSLKL